MALGNFDKPQQDCFWVETQSLARGPGHVFYDKLSALLAEHEFDRICEERCSQFYAENVGRPGLPPGVYFRMLMIGYFEGIDSERGIAWRVEDSLTLRRFLGFTLDERTPDHSTLSRIRNRIDLDTHREIFRWVLATLAMEGLLKAKTLGVDSTTLEANAALRSIVRRDTGEAYDEFLTDLAKASGNESPTRQDLAKLDRKRPKKGSNKEWKHPHDPDARITKMKDGRTHLAHKAEHAVDMDTGAIVEVQLHGADEGDTQTLEATVEGAKENIDAVCEEGDARRQMHAEPARELVADKGYHSNGVVDRLHDNGIRSYISEPDRGRRRWKDKPKTQANVYANRQRIRGERGKRLMRQRGEILERSFAHCYETGAMRRCHLRGHDNILKRLLIHVGAFNLSLVLRRNVGVGTPRQLANALAAPIFTALSALSALRRRVTSNQNIFTTKIAWRQYRMWLAKLNLSVHHREPLSTGC